MHCWEPDEGARGDGRWELWRQDDAGNRILVSRHASRDEAEASMAEYEARGHKQTYWVAERD